MFNVFIPGFGELALEHLVMDYNGTMACDGLLVDGLKELIVALSRDLQVHVLTADTFGSAALQLEGLPVALFVLPEKKQDEAKLAYIEKLGAHLCVSIGNGRNDALMLEKSKVGIALIQEEGAAVKTILSGDILCKDIHSALNLFLMPGRLIATLRS